MSTAFTQKLDPESVAFDPPPVRSRPAYRIRDDAEALAVAREVAAELALGAVRRDRERILPYEELERISDTGLLAITVPAEFGGAGVSAGTVARVIATLAGADGSLGQIPQNHFFLLEGLRLSGTEAQKRFFYNRILAGERIFNALSERGTKTAQDHVTRLTRAGDGFALNGRKFYSTGVLFAHWIGVVANDDAGESTLSFVPATAPGVTVIDDWTGFGQRTTGSGTTVLDDVAVAPFSVIPFKRIFDVPTGMGPFAQIMHAAVEQGIAEAALATAIHFVRHHTRPWKESGVDRASDDPYIVSAVGEMSIRTDAAGALLERAGGFVDAARAAPDEGNVAAASVAVAEAKVATTEAALFASTKLIELAGSSATLQEHGLDRFWRNARTHTVHDPVRWKYKVIGDYWLNGRNPPRHGAI
ncbi:SfnB family sulfur acquisition oxidoreductase [Lichenihabitans sp. Uapishka_5]|uniref:SfnB family sulfur acquisition oxidoreductase n=1 Tax=Lichenihabitans sp. Uapishka_5 TaxID=3037302 RepID=UPI0029E813A2|nr:SfnB family sulfur acquisition oxidoreductase [Lichenihabitans sp. Uapishka_5]MDX7950326.1 SfnB family sulfur acquisition oxidoreductase [Lichenihabitans sp. Uapishka_5]